jgi:hypothetical protein
MSRGRGLSEACATLAWLSWSFQRPHEQFRVTTPATVSLQAVYEGGWAPSSGSCPGHIRDASPGARPRLFV